VDDAGQLSQVSRAVVGRIMAIASHPNADRLEVIKVAFNEDPGSDVMLVTGKHYRVGDLGVWLRPGAWIPGWLAFDLWMVGKERATQPFEVREIPIRGVVSPGLWCGQWYRKDKSKESRLRWDDIQRGGGRVVDGWIEWNRWGPAWKVGDTVDEALGVSPFNLSELGVSSAHIL
jgi:tRNA-binding EMAP/Myf-like protein